MELSGAVLHNWINKTVNLLVEEFDAAPGTRVLLDLPSHWRAIVWGSPPGAQDPLSCCCRKA
ncbi:hypothetical protein NKG05_21105 [Oerskovia sp. M15]